MKKRFICYGGWVRSNYDGDLHYINAHQVAELHGVDPRECIVVRDSREDLQCVDRSRYLELYPSQAGSYSPVTPAERRAYPVGDEDWPGQEESPAGQTGLS